MIAQERDAKYSGYTIEGATAETFAFHYMLWPQRSTVREIMKAEGISNR